MEFNIPEMEPMQAYRLLASVVVPRPIALVTSLGEEGEINAAPFSFFNLMGSQPPVVALGIGNRGLGTPKDSRANIERTGEFVVNLVDETLADAMNVCGIDFPAGTSELAAAGLTALPSVKVAPPRVAEARVGLECRLATVATVGENKIVLAEVIFLHIRDEYIDTERFHVRTEALQLIGRMHGGGWYARTSDLFDLPRIPLDDWTAKSR